MRNDYFLGGGPEIVALVNVLRRPSQVYELWCKRPKRFAIWRRRMACYGSLNFDRREPLHILSAGKAA
jgi:hypothetical protein